MKELGPVTSFPLDIVSDIMDDDVLAAFADYAATKDIEDITVAITKFANDHFGSLAKGYLEVAKLGPARLFTGISFDDIIRGYLETLDDAGKNACVGFLQDATIFYAEEKGLRMKSQQEQAYANDDTDPVQGESSLSEENIEDFGPDEDEPPPIDGLEPPLEFQEYPYDDFDVFANSLNDQINDADCRKEDEGKKAEERECLEINLDDDPDFA